MHKVVQDKKMDVSKLEKKLDELLAEDSEYVQNKQRNAKNLINRIMSISDDPESRERIYKKFQLYLNPQDLPELVLRQISSKGWSFSHSTSFRSLIALDTFRRKEKNIYSAWPLNNKEKSLKFISKFDISVPTVYQDAVKLDALKIKNFPSIVKPLFASSSHGVYIALNPTTFREVKTAKEFTSFDKVKGNLRQALRTKNVARDLWKVEELVADIKGERIRPARDLKFYCFYGKVGMVLEIDREFGAKFRIRERDGSVGTGGEFKESDDFPLTDITEGDIAIAEKLSSEIPVPFLSIDFLKTEDRLVFCEFTPRPGYAFKYKPEYDAHLGLQYLNAEARLHNDLVNGKKFALYLDYCKEINALQNLK